jgi:hypothetical protein
MTELGRQSGRSEPEPKRDQEGEVAAAMEEYLKLAHGDVRLALAVSVADGIAVSRLVSTGFARWRQPARRRPG